MAHQYSVKAGTRGWPVAVICIILDLACINAFVLYWKGTGNFISRQDFIFKGATELRENYLVQRRARKKASEQESSRSSKKSLTRNHEMRAKMRHHRVCQVHSLQFSRMCHMYYE